MIAPLVNSLEDLAKWLSIQKLPGKTMIPYIKEIPWSDGFMSTHPAVDFFSKEAKKVRQHLPENQKMDEFIQPCKIQQVFKQPQHNQYIGVEVLSSSDGNQDLLNEIIQLQPRFTSMDSDSRESAPLKKLDILDLLDKYDFTLEIPDETNSQVKTFAKVKESIADMIKSVGYNLSTYPIATKMQINGGAKR